MRPALRLPPSTERLIVQGRTWWDGRAPREQALLLCLATLVVLSLAIVGFVKPVQQARTTAIADIAMYDALAARLRAAGPGLTPPTGRTVRSGPLQTLVTATAGESGLQIRQIEQQGAATAVALDGADFVRLVQWLERLDREANVSVTSARLERQTVPGTVNARLSLVRR